MDEFNEMSLVKKIAIGVITLIVLTASIFTIGVMNRHYQVWAQEMAGKAKLAEATQSRQIQIEQAKAEKESAKYRAEAIKIVGAAAKKFPEYRHQEFIGAFAEALKDGNINQIIYVPTEAGIPITEAGKRPAIN